MIYQLVPEAVKNIQAIIQSILSDTEELLKTTNETNQISKDQKNALITVSEAMKELEDSAGGYPIQFIKKQDPLKDQSTKRNGN
ncbi:hypothetical protein ACWGJQ_01590 [Peribacillus simplex]